jgi:hypothetical protein
MLVVPRQAIAVPLRRVEPILSSMGSEKGVGLMPGTSGTFSVKRWLARRNALAWIAPCNDCSGLSVFILGTIDNDRYNWRRTLAATQILAHSRCPQDGSLDKLHRNLDSSKRWR